MPQFPDRLSRWAAEAKALGMSYGDYVAKYHPPGSASADLPIIDVKPTYTKTCPECGRTFQTTYPRKIYCESRCYERVKKRRDYHKKKAKEGASC